MISMECKNMEPSMELAGEWAQKPCHPASCQACGSIWSPQDGEIPSFFIIAIHCISLELFFTNSSGILAFQKWVNLLFCNLLQAEIQVPFPASACCLLVFVSELPVAFLEVSLSCSSACRHGLESEPAKAYSLQGKKKENRVLTFYLLPFFYFPLNI